MSKPSCRRLRLVLLLPLILSGLLMGLQACQPGRTAAGSDQAVSAAGTATALIQNAQSTVIVMKAQALATSLVETLSAPQETAAPEPLPTTARLTVAPSTQAGSSTVEIVAVTTAAEGAYIMVEFRAPARLVETWYQGRVSITDEKTGSVYAEIPSVGTVGLLIGRPKSDGQLGYVMLVNGPAPLGPGAVVTVALGDFREQHLIIQ